MKKLSLLFMSLSLTTSQTHCASAQALRYLKLAGSVAWQGAKKGTQWTAKNPQLLAYGAAAVGGYGLIATSSTDSNRNFFTTLQQSRPIFTAYAEERTIKKVRIYHHINRNGSINSVKQHGLLSFNELYRQGLTNQTPPQNCYLFPDQYDVIYFRYLSTYPVDEQTVCLEVDPDITYVYNQEFRVIGRAEGWYRYQHSRVLLSTFIANREKAECLRKTIQPGQTVIFNPQTSEPFIVSIDDPRAKNYLYHFIPEVIFHRTKITPEELIFPLET